MLPDVVLADVFLFQTSVCCPLPQNDLRLVRNGKSRGVEVVGVAFKYVEEDQALLGLRQGSDQALGPAPRR